MYTKPILPLTLIAFCFTVVVGALILPPSTMTTRETTSNILAQEKLSSREDVEAISFKNQKITVQEGKRVKIVLSSSIPIKEITKVRVKVTGGTAKQTVDFTAPRLRTITFFTGGPTEKSFSFLARDDKNKEQPETVILSLYSMTDEPLHQSIVVTINDNTSPQVSLIRPTFSLLTPFLDLGKGK